MKVQAFCPAHITCFFSPVKSDDILNTGSLGAGIRLGSGTTVSATIIEGNDMIVLMDGTVLSDSIAETAFRKIISEGGYKLEITNDLPVGQGFGTSASGAIAAALCACGFSDKDESEAFVAAHIAEVVGGGGLGDVAALSLPADQPIRIEAGIGKGRVSSSEISFDKITLAIIGGKVSTAGTLSDPILKSKITENGKIALDAFLKDPVADNLFSLSNTFSSTTNLESPQVEKALIILRENGFKAAMCMLGNSIITDAKPEEVLQLLGHDIVCYEDTTTKRSAEITRRE